MASPLPDRFRSLIKSLGAEAGEALKKQGLKIQAGELAEWIAQYSPTAAKGLLTTAMNLTRPFTRGLGIVVSEFSDEHIEVTIPEQERLKEPSGELHEAVVYAVASEALRLMWEKDIAESQIQVKKYECELLAPLRGSLRCRFELLKLDQQRLSFEAQNGKAAEATATLPILGSGDRILAQVSIDYRLHQPTALAEPTSK